MMYSSMRWSSIKNVNIWNVQKHAQPQTITLSYYLVCNIKTDTPEDDIADLETCRVKANLNEL